MSPRFRIPRRPRRADGAPGAAAGPEPAADAAPAGPPPSSGTADELEGRRALHLQEPRDRIYRAAAELFTERGFDATTMEDIAERAQVGLATLSGNFARKTAFISEWALQRRRTAEAGIRRRHLDGHLLPEVLAGYMSELARISTRARAETVAFTQGTVRTGGVRHPELASEIAAIVARAQAAGEVRPQVRPAMAGKLVAACYFAILRDWTDTDPPPFSLEEQLLQMVDLLCTGVLAEPWE